MNIIDINYAQFFCFHDDNENEAVEAHIQWHRDSTKTKKTQHQDSKTKKPGQRDSKTKKSRHRDSKTKKPSYRDFKTKKPRHWDSGTKTLGHRETETNKPRYRDSKAFFQRTKRHDIKIPRLKNHDIEIPRSKSHDIEFLWNSDPYVPWYQTDITSSYKR